MLSSLFPDSHHPISTQKPPACQLLRNQSFSCWGIKQQPWRETRVFQKMKRIMQRDKNNLDQLAGGMAGWNHLHHCSQSCSQECVCPTALTAAAFAIRNNAEDVYARRQLRLTEFHLASRCLCVSVCVCPHKNKLLARCCWFSVAAGWVAAEGKQAAMPLLACHSFRAGVCVCVRVCVLVGVDWIDGCNYVCVQHFCCEVGSLLKFQLNICWRFEEVSRNFRKIW